MNTHPVAVGDSRLEACSRAELFFFYGLNKEHAPLHLRGLLAVYWFLEGNRDLLPLSGLQFKKGLIDRYGRSASARILPGR